MDCLSIGAFFCPTGNRRLTAICVHGICLRSTYERAMQVDVQRVSPVMLELKVEVPADTVNTEVNNAYQAVGKTARVRGFRRGKAPRKILAQLYGPSIRRDVAQRLVEQSLQQALKDKAIQPLTQPAVEPAELKSKKAFSFKARFEVRPEIEKVEWEGLAASRKASAVDDAAIDAEVEKLRNQHSTLEPIEDRASENGDVATLALTFMHGDNEHTEEVDAELGGGTILPAIEEGAVGMKVGESKDVTTNFPDNHRDEGLRGQETSFKIELKELKKRVLPNVDDEFAKDCEHEDLAAMRAALKTTLEKQAEQQQEEDVARQLVAQLCEKNPVPVPPSLVQQQRQMTERELEMMAQMSGQQLDRNALRQRLQADAEMKVRAGLLMAEIATEKEIKVSEEDIEQGYVELAEQTGKNVAKVRVEYRQREKREMLIGMILEDKVLDLLEKSANITDAG